MNIAGREVPTPVVVVGGVVVGYVALKWWRSRSAAGSATTAGAVSSGLADLQGPPGPAGTSANPATTNWLQAQVNDLYRNVRGLNRAEAKEGKKKAAPHKAVQPRKQGSTALPKNVPTSPHTARPHGRSVVNPTRRTA